MNCEYLKLPKCTYCKYPDNNQTYCSVDAYRKLMLNSSTFISIRNNCISWLRISKLYPTQKIYIIAALRSFPERADCVNKFLLLS